MLNVQRLRVLREVARQGSFSAAAEALSFTQPAVSKQIATLEREAGAKLLERTPRGIQLTEAGQVLIDHTEVILARLSAAEQQLEALQALECGRVRLAAFPSADAMLVPEAIAIFDGRYPDVALSLEEALSDDCLALLRAGEVDLAVVSDYGGQSAWDPEGIELIELADDQMCVALSRDHPLAGKDVVRVKDLADEIWIEGLNPQCFIPLRNACAAAGFEPKVCFRSTQWLGKQGLVAAGVGVTLIPSLAAGGVRDDIALRPLGPNPPSRKVYAAVLPDSDSCSGVDAMVGVLREATARCLERFEERISAPLPVAA
jgi:DNA-binding transcriptional LysR family regulator